MSLVSPSSDVVVQAGTIMGEELMPSLPSPTPDSASDTQVFNSQATSCESAVTKPVLTEDGAPPPTEEYPETRLNINPSEDGVRYKDLKDNQVRVLVSELLDPIKITFSGNGEMVRLASKILPGFFYRTFYETSITLSPYVSKDTHAKHRETPALKIKKGNAFQSVGISISIKMPRKNALSDTSSGIRGGIPHLTFQCSIPLIMLDAAQISTTRPHNGSDTVYQ